MARTRTSPAGRRAAARRGQGGFTLLELLVVLTVIALVMAVIPGFVLRDGRAQVLDHAADAVAHALRDARAAAIQDNRDSLFTINMERRLFRAGEAGAPVRIDEGIDIGMITARQERLGETAGAIRFFPDGSSTGGRLTLSIDGRRQAVEVDWLTGGVSVARHGD